MFLIEYIQVEKKKNKMSFFIVYLKLKFDFWKYLQIFNNLKYLRNISTLD